MAQKRRQTRVQQNTYREKNRSAQSASRNGSRTVQEASRSRSRPTQSTARNGSRAVQEASRNGSRSAQSASRSGIRTVQEASRDRSRAVQEASRSRSRPAQKPSPDGRRESRQTGKKRRKGGNRRLKLLAAVVSVIAVMVLLGYFAVGVCKVKQIEVTGNQYCSEQEILDWITSGKYSDNSLYVYWKYNQKDVEQLPAVAETQVKLKSPWKLQVKVTEKTFSGRIDYDGEFLYFDSGGMAALKIPDIIEGVPYIEGMEVDAEKLKLGAALPVKDSGVFEDINEVSGLLKEYELTPNKISCADSGLTLYFGGIRVILGSNGFSDKLAQVPPILAKMSELYADQTGTLHLENYEISDASVRFVPDTAPQEE